MSGYSDKTVLITGSGGLIGSACVDLWAQLGCAVIGIDCDGRKLFFGQEGTVAPKIAELKSKHDGAYSHYDLDLRHRELVDTLVESSKPDLVIHCAGQPSHDFSGSNPLLDWDINATGTLNLLEAVRTHCRESVVVFTSTNKVYGDAPNRLNYIEGDSRWSPELPQVAGLSSFGFSEQLNPEGLGPCSRTPFGTSKLAADLMVQEYGRYFGMRTATFRLGCVTGSGHAAVQLHGFLAYLAKCIHLGREFSIYGYEGKQVRDNIHAADVASAFKCFYDNDPDAGGECYNMGGGAQRSLSILEAADGLSQIIGKKFMSAYVDQPRVADHQWWVTDTSKFQLDHPDWSYAFSIDDLLEDFVNASEAGVG